jgi:hypothetical protein
VNSEPAISATNRYLRSRLGVSVGGRGFAALVFFGPMIGGILASVLGGAIGSGAGAILALLGALSFVASIVGGWVFLLRGTGQVDRASHAAGAGDRATATALCLSALTTVFRADVRIRALYTLGLCAEANGDFTEALDLFTRSLGMIPVGATPVNQRRARTLIQSHRALALVALGQIAEADLAVREASAQFAGFGPSGFSLGFFDDSSMGALGVNAAVTKLEPYRDPRALLTLASALVLVSKNVPRDALDLLERERSWFGTGLMPRERVLVARIEARARAMLGGGPMRAPRAPAEAADPEDAWVERVLLPHAARSGF